MLGEKGIPSDTEAGRNQFVLDVERRRAEEAAADYEEIRNGWFLGSEEFRQGLLAMAGKQVGLNHYGAERSETSAQNADRIIAEEVLRLGWPDNELRRRLKGDPAKVALARRLRQETTMSLQWIADRLHMGSWTYVSNLLNQKPSSRPQPQAVLPLFH